MGALQVTLSEARPLTAFPEAEAVAPAGTCAAVAAIDKGANQQHAYVVTHLPPSRGFDSQRSDG